MKHRIFTIAALATAMLASCSSEEELAQSSFPTDNVVRITASIPHTRAGYTTSNLSEFGICISNPVRSQYTYRNVKVTKSSSDGSWTPEELMLWHNLTDTVDIVAYAPYSSKVGALYGISDYKVSVDKDQNENGIIENDFLVFSKIAFVPKNGLKSDGTLDIELKHAFSQLVLTITFNTEYSPLTSNPVTGLCINGVKVDGTCDFTMENPQVVATGSATSVTPETGNFTSATSSTDRAKATYTCVLIPQDIAASNFYVKFNLNGKEYYWVSSASLSLKGGMSYQLDLTVGNDKTGTAKMSAREWENSYDKALKTY